MFALYSLHHVSNGSNERKCAPYSLYHLHHYISLNDITMEFTIIITALQPHY